MSEKSDPDYTPDEAEPWDNRPDAVADLAMFEQDLSGMRLTGEEHGVDYRWDVRPHADAVWVRANGVLPFDVAVRFANAILSEVEIAQRDDVPQRDSHGRPNNI